MNDAGSVSRRKPHPLDLDPSVYLRNDYVVLDFETTNLDYGSPSTASNSIVLSSWMLGDDHPEHSGHSQAVRSVYGNEYEQRELVDAVARASFVVAYNAKFEAGWLRRCGVELRDLIVYDPMLGEYVLGGNVKPDGGLSLDNTLFRYGIPGKMRYVSELIEAGVCPSDIPKHDLVEYCECDCRRTHDLFLRQRPKLFEQSRERVFYGRCVQAPMLADIESHGAYLDEQRVLSKHSNVVREYGRLDRALCEFTGPVNWNSPKQIANLLYDKLGFAEATDYRGLPIRTDSGARSTSESTVHALKSSTTEQSKFKSLYAQITPLKKALSTLETMKEICDVDDGHFFANYNQAVTQNHRLSSTGGKWGIQLQNSDRSFKTLFRAREAGRSIAEGDCPQLEYRVAGDLSGDPRILGDVLARADVHSLTSSVTGFSRQDSKPHTFKPVYGGRSGPPKLVKYYDAFRARYRVLYQTQMGWCYHVLEFKELETVTGLKFYWPDTRMEGRGYIRNTTKIFNYPISMFATADISQLSLWLTWQLTRDLDSSLCNTIHDSGVADVVNEDVDKFKEVMVHCYTDGIYDALDRLYDYRFSLPLGLGFKSGSHWTEGTEEKFEAERRFKFSSDVPTKISLS